MVHLRASWYNPYLSRFIQPDSVVPRPGDPQSPNRYGYVANNPTRYTDASGEFLDTIADIAFIAYDLYEIKQKGWNWQTGLALAADVGGALLPVVTGGGAMVRAAGHADDVGDTLRVAGAADRLNDAVDIPRGADGLDAVDEMLGLARQTDRLVPPGRTTAEIRALPGVVTGGENLVDVERMLSGTHGNAGVIPKEIADQLRGREFASLREFREAFWKAVAESSYAAEFTEDSYYLMRAGYAPKVDVCQRVGKLKKYILHHMDPIYLGGGGCTTWTTSGS